MGLELKGMWPLPNVGVPEPATPTPRTSTPEPGPCACPKEMACLPTRGLSGGGRQVAHLLAPLQSWSGDRVGSL